MDKNKKLLCYKCNLELELQKTYFEYLDHSFFHDILKCPGCEQVFIPEDLAKGRMSEVERELEDK